MKRSTSSPLTPAMFEILVSLADGERHGYSIMQDIERRQGHQGRMGPATLYRSIQRLLEGGLIAESEARPRRVLDDERRRYYRMTQSGRRAAEAEARRMADLVALAETKRLLPRTRER